MIILNVHTLHVCMHTTSCIIGLSTFCCTHNHHNHTVYTSDLLTSGIVTSLLFGHSFAKTVQFQRLLGGRGEVTSKTVRSSLIVVLVSTRFKFSSWSIDARKRVKISGTILREFHLCRYYKYKFHQHKNLSIAMILLAVLYDLYPCKLTKGHKNNTNFRSFTEQ